MAPDRHPRGTGAAALLTDVRSTWPPTPPPDTRGYRPLDLAETTPVAVCDLDPGRLVVVVGRDAGPRTALPCLWDGDRLAIAAAGDGVAAALLTRSDDRLDAGFGLSRFAPQATVSPDERDLGTDQSNISVVVGD